LRGINIIGGVNTEVPVEILHELVGKLKELLRDFNEVIAISENSSSL